MVSEKSGHRLSGILVLQLASLAVVALNLLLSISFFPSLPQTVAVHYDLSGAPNGWETKSWISVLQPWFIQLGMFLLMAGVALLFMYSPRFLAYLNLPDIDTEKLLKLPDEEKKRVRWLAAFGTSLISLFVLLFVGYINYDILRSAIMGRGPSDGPILSATAALLVCTFTAIRWLTASVKQIARQ